MVPECSASFASATGRVRCDPLVAHPARRVPGRDRRCRRRRRVGLRGSPSPHCVRARRHRRHLDRRDPRVPDSNGLWHAELIRDLIEDLLSDHIETGLCNAKLHSRGLVWSSPACGVLERHLAAQFPGMARARRRQLAPNRGAPAQARRSLRRVGATGRRSIRGLRGRRPQIQSHRFL
jgi:hypothetical protein